MNPAVYFWQKGVFSRPEAEQCADFIHRHLPDGDDPTLFEEEKLIGKHVFHRNACVLFIDWCFLHHYENNEQIAAFVKKVANVMAYGPARRFARNARGFFRVATAYYQDALAALTVDVAYRATDRIIIRLEDIQDDGVRVPTVHWLSDGQKRNRSVVYRPTMLVNGEYRCLHRSSVIINAHDVVGGFVTLRPFENSGQYNLEEWRQVWCLSCRTRGTGPNKQFIKGESYFRQCCGIAIANFVGMEIGRITNGVDELAIESKEARKSRRTNQNRLELLDLLNTAEESGEFSELDMQILRLMFNPEFYDMSKPDMQDKLNLAINERTFQRMLKSSKERFQAYCRRYLD